MTVKKALNVAGNADLLVASVALCVLIIVSAVTVVSRYILNDPFMWSEEVQVLCFMWISFLGAGVAFRYGSHVAIDVFVNLIPPKPRRYVDLLLSILVTVVLCYALYLSIVYVDQSIMLQKRSSILQIPDWCFCISVVFGFASMIVSNACMSVKSFLNTKA